MPDFRLRTALLLFPTLLLLFSCTTDSTGQRGFRDDVFVVHPLCGVALEDPCRDVKVITFAMFTNSEAFSAALESTQNYLEATMPATIEDIFSPDTTFRTVGLPFTMAGSSSNFDADDGEMVVEIIYIDNTEEMLEPMLILVISSRDVLAVRHAVCGATAAATDLCQNEFQELMEFYFTSDFF